MTKQEMIQHLRMVAVSENTITGMSNAFDLGAGKGKMLAVSIEPSGEISWAIYWDGYREHGTHQMPKREWVGLTDDDELDWEEGGNLKDLIKAIEAKLKEKNT